MEAVARAKYLRGSARKMRLIADTMRGQNVVWAAERLKFMPQRAARNLRKIVDAATANALSVEGTAKLKAEDLRITKLTIDGGPIARRFRPVCMGRAYRIRKRYCHVTVVISDQELSEKRKVSRGKAKKTEE